MGTTSTTTETTAEETQAVSSSTFLSHFGRVGEHGPSSAARPVEPFLLEPDRTCTLDRDLSRKSTTHSGGTAYPTFEAPLLQQLSPFAGADTALALVPNVVKSQDVALSCFTATIHSERNKDRSLLAPFLKPSPLLMDATAFAPAMVVVSEEMEIVPFDKDIPIVVCLNSMRIPPYDNGDDVNNKNKNNNNDDGDDDISFLSLPSVWESPSVSYYDEQLISPNWLQPNHQQRGRCTRTYVDEASAQDKPPCSGGNSRHLLQVRSLPPRSAPAHSKLVFPPTTRKRSFRSATTASIPLDVDNEHDDKPMVFLGRRFVTAIFLAAVLPPTIFSVYNQRNVPDIARQRQSIPLEQLLQGPTFFYNGN
jgi:hypothetical protein